MQKNKPIHHIGIDASRANKLEKTGVEWYAYFIIEELKRIVPANISVTLYTDTPLQGDLAILPPHWKQKVLRWPPRKLWTQCRLSIELLVHPVDVLWVPAHVPPYIRPNKTVMTVHDVAAIRWKHAYSWFERWYSVWAATVALNKLSAIIVPSEFTKKELTSLAGSNHAAVHVIYHGYNPVYTQKIPHALAKKTLQQYGIHQPYLVYLGRVEEKKNIPRLIRAFSKIKQSQEGKQYQLVLIGKPGYGFAEVQKEINSSLYKKDIICVGWVPNEQVQHLLQQAVFLAYPSLYEGFGIPILEGFANHIPVLTSKGLSTEEIAKDAAYYVDPQNEDDMANGMHTLICQKEIREAYIQKGKEQLKNFSWQKAAKQTYAVIVDE